MLRNDINKLTDEYGVKKEAIIKLFETNRVTFAKMMKDNSFDQYHKARLYLKYSRIL
jgi:hypothetical protein